MENTQNLQPDVQKTTYISQPDKKPKFNIWMISAIVLFLALILVGAYALNQKQIASQLIHQPTNLYTETIPTIDPTADWKTYISKKYNFIFKYPADWKKLESILAVKFYLPNSTTQLDPATLHVSWHDSEVATDKLSPRCYKTNNCQEVLTFTNPYNINLTIWKPNPQYRKELGLSDEFLYAFINNSDKIVGVPEFTTDLLLLPQFKQILSTFQFTN